MTLKPYGMAALLVACFLNGCAAWRQGGAPTASTRPHMAAAAAGAATADERRALLASANARLIAQCDSCMSRIGEATDTMRRATADPHIWTAAMSLKVAIGTSVVNIASQDEPDVGLLNITTVLMLEYEVMSSPEPDGRTYAEATFGPSAKLFVDTLNDLQAKSWRINADFYAKDKLDEFRAMLVAWHKRHPEARYVADVRLDSLADTQGRASVARSGMSTGFPMIVNIDDATRAVDQVRRLGERGLFVTQRMPTLLRWQAELLALNVANQPAATREMAAIDQANANITKLTPDLQYFLKTIPATLEKIQPELHDLVTTLPATLKESQPLVDKLQLTTADIRASLVTIDEMTKRMSPPATQAGGTTSPAASQPAGEPFSIEKYTQAAAQLAQTAHSLRELVDSTDHMLETPAWKARFDDVDLLTKQRLAELNQVTQQRIDSVFVRVVEATAIFFGCLLVYRVIAVKLLPHRTT